MTRLAIFASLSDRDGLVSAGTLAAECSISVHRAAQWLSAQAMRDRIVRVAEGLYQSVRDGRPERPPSELRRATIRRCSARQSARLAAERRCLDCGGDLTGEHRRCDACREKRNALAKSQRAKEVDCAAE